MPSHADKERFIDEDLPSIVLDEPDAGLEMAYWAADALAELSSDAEFRVVGTKNNLRQYKPPASAEGLTSRKMTKAAGLMGAVVLAAGYARFRRK